MSLLNSAISDVEYNSIVDKIPYVAIENPSFVSVDIDKEHVKILDWNSNKPRYFDSDNMYIEFSCFTTDGKRHLVRLNLKDSEVAVDLISRVDPRDFHYYLRTLDMSIMRGGRVVITDVTNMSFDDSTFHKYDETDFDHWENPQRPKLFRFTTEEKTLTIDITTKNLEQAKIKVKGDWDIVFR